MNDNPPDQPDEFGDVERRLVNARPSFTEPELDNIKLRALARASRPRRGGQTKGLALRSRALRIAVSLTAFAGVGIGGIAAFDVFASASVGQYGTSGSSGCADYFSSGEHSIPVGDWYLDVTGTISSHFNTTDPLTATLYKCGTGGNAVATPPTSTLTIFLSCGNAAPPGGEGSACSGGPATFSGTNVSASNTLTFSTSTDTETFNVKFSADGSPYVIASGSGVGTAGSVSTNPYAGYDTGTITHS